MASSSSPAPRFTYHVFLSFRGEDTRKNFTDHLYTALTQSGINTFRDDDEIRRGEHIESEINHAIRQSKLSILVLSSDYASSRWCLDELALIMDRRKTHGHIVVPIYYDVLPSDVHALSGSYGEAFAQHRNCFDDDVVDRWRLAISQLARLQSHLVLHDRYESEFVQAVVKQVAKLLNRTLVDVSTHLVGMDYRAGLVNLWLQNESADATVAAIYGVGGVGKSTIAKIVYNQNFDKFDAGSFLADIRSVSGQPNGLVRLQRQLLSDLTKGSAPKVYGADEGIVKIKDALYRKKVLLILDDVDHSEQLDVIMGLLQWFHKGSKILITTRHQHIMGAHAVSLMLKVKELDDKESIQLFSWHAFSGADRPDDGYELLSKEAVDRCGGIPLALQVLGSSLCGKSNEVWESVLQRLKRVPETDIQSIFQISFGSLEDDHDRNLFLDIACFFNGMDVDYVARIAGGCGFFAVVGIKNLNRRCLVSISEENKLTMHQLVVEMGREIVRQESVDDPGKRSRLWDHKDSFMVLKEKKGTDLVKGLTLDVHKGSSHYQTQSQSGDSKGNVSKRQRRLGFFPHKPADSTSQGSFSIQSAARMQKLKLLHLNDVKFKGDYKNFPRNIVWLRWKGFPMECMPNELSLEKLVVLDMRNSNLKYLWKETKFLPELKILNLNHSHNLVRTPNFNGLPSLERLLLKDCASLTELDESICDLKGLELLNLQDCTSLRKLPSDFGTLKSCLCVLILSGCLNLQQMPKDLSEMESLKFLAADGVGKNQSLNLSKNPFGYLPEDINKLGMLETLELEQCTKLEALPELPTSLSILKADDCSSLNRIANLPNLLEWLDLEVHGCERITEIGGLFRLEPLSSIDSEVLNNLGLFDLESFEGIEIEMSNALSCTTIKTPIQVLQECNIFSTFIPGSEVPDWFNIRVEESSSLSMVLPAASGLKIRGLSLCTAYTGKWESEEEKETSLVDENYLKIINETSGVKWCYSPMFFGIPRAKVAGSRNSMLWLSHWTFGEYLEAGDELHIVMDLAACFEVQGCGIRVIYEQQQESSKAKEIAESSSSSRNLSGYEVGRDAFLLSHHMFLTHQGAPRDDWDDLSGYEYLFEPNASEDEYVTDDEM
ncbi:unnamed protein product [Linum trigynum]|uniref:ADP-ribosyl cyclase/cyclic ADP-ribose hydrolase n=1 Tax=Linum trigynum TaxID=586398 RepID=A0AAV2EHI0_9ROSI